MTLAEQNDRLKQDMMTKIPQEVLARSVELMKDVHALNIEERASKVGDAIPPFELPGVDGQLVSSANLLSSGPLVLSFYRGGW